MFNKILLTVTVFLCSSIHAQEAIRLIVPFSAGGPADRVARLIQKDMQTHANQNVIVETRPGANGELAAKILSQAKPNETVLMIVGTSLNFALNPTRYDFQNLVPVLDIGKSVMLITVNQDGRIKSFKDMVNLPANDSLTYGDSGTASLSYLAGELLRVSLGKNLISVPYLGTSKRMIDFLGNRLDLNISHISDVDPYLATGQIKPIVVLSEQRISEFPDVPTAREFGIQDGVINSHWVLLSNNTTNLNDIVTVQKTMTKVLSDPKLNQAYRDEKIMIAPGNKALAKDFVQKDVKRIDSLLQKINLKSNTQVLP